MTIAKVIVPYNNWQCCGNVHIGNSLEYSWWVWTEN